MISNNASYLQEFMRFDILVVIVVHYLPYQYEGLSWSLKLDFKVDVLVNMHYALNKTYGKTYH